MSMTARKADLFSSALTLSLSVVMAGAIGACRRPRQSRATHPVASSAASSPFEASNRLPSDLFRNMPIYPGMTVVHVRKPKGGMREIMFRLDNAPALEKLIDFYKEGLKKNNFTITSSLVMRARNTWSCDFHKMGRPGSIALYPTSKDRSNMTLDLIYEIPTKDEQRFLEPVEKFDVIGPGRPGMIAQKAWNEKVKRN
jgi:hypothetical protein